MGKTILIPVMRKILDLSQAVVAQLLQIRSQPVKDWQPILKWAYIMLFFAAMYNYFIDADQETVIKTIDILTDFFTGEL